MFIRILFVEILLGLGRKHIPPERFEDWLQVCFARHSNAIPSSVPMLLDFLVWGFKEHVGNVNKITNMSKGRFSVTINLSLSSQIIQIPFFVTSNIRIYSFKSPFYQMDSLSRVLTFSWGWLSFNSQPNIVPRPYLLSLCGLSDSSYWVTKTSTTTPSPLVLNVICTFVSFHFYKMSSLFFKSCLFHPHFWYLSGAIFRLSRLPDWQKEKSPIPLHFFLLNREKAWLETAI